MLKIYTIQELSTLSLKEIKDIYSQLARAYAKRLYARSKETNKELFNALYGDRLTAKEMEKEFLAKEENEKWRYINAYDNMVNTYGREGFTSKAQVARISFAQMRYPHVSAAKAVNLLNRETKVAKSGKLIDELNKMGYQANLDDISDLVQLYVQLDPMDSESFSSLGVREHNFSSEAEFRTWLLEELEKFVQEE